jgi:hypothetical protein
MRAAQTRLGATGLSRRNCCFHALSISATGRQAPVKRCLARSLLQQKRNYRKALAVRQLAMNLRRIAGRDLDLLSQAPHALGLLGAEQVALSGVPAHHFSRRRQLKSLRRASMGLRFDLCSWFSCHNIPR